MASVVKLGRYVFNYSSIGRYPSYCKHLFLPEWNQERNYAVRKGTRMKLLKKKQKAKVEKEEPKKSFIPYKKLHEQEKKGFFKKRSERGKKLLEAPNDDVYCFKHYKWIKFSIEDAVKMHRESHHPSIYNEPNALVYAYLELDLKLPKKTRCLDVFSSLVHLPHNFEYGEDRRILAICSRPEEQEQAREAGAHTVGGTELISMIQSGDLLADEFRYVISTPDLLNELIPIRGILKNRFPLRPKGTLTFDIKKAVGLFAKGIDYKSRLDINEKEYGIVEVPIGRLPMSPEHLEANLDALIKDVCKHKDPKLGPFVTVLFITCPPSPEKFFVPFEKYVPIHEDEALQSDN